jgi:hypothetical protein
VNDGADNNQGSREVSTSEIESEGNDGVSAEVGAISNPVMAVSSPYISEETRRTERQNLNK